MEELGCVEELFGGRRECVPVVGEGRGGEVEIGARFGGWRWFRRGFGSCGQIMVEDFHRMRSQTC